MGCGVNGAICLKITPHIILIFGYYCDVDSVGDTPPAQERPSEASVRLNQHYSPANAVVLKGHLSGVPPWWPFFLVWSRVPPRPVGPLDQWRIKVRG